MNISIVNKWETGGGAARAAWRLKNALQQHSDHNISYIVHDKRSESSDVFNIDFQNPTLCHADGIIQSSYIDKNRTSFTNTYFSNTFNSYLWSNNDVILASDVINLHWIEKMLSPYDFAELCSLGKPIVWTMHDMRPITGGCHYAEGCESFSYSRCKQCIQLQSDPFGLPNINYESKSLILSHFPITFVSPSKWLADQARKSALTEFCNIQIIPNSVEDDVFFPVNKKAAKKRLGLDLNGFLILLGCQDFAERRKGFDLSLEVLGYLNHLLRNSFSLSQAHSDERPISIACFGGCTNFPERFPFPVHSFGTVSNDEILRYIYSAADVFLLTTRADNLPNTILESMACGTPTFCFDVGGVSDLVIPRDNGMLAPAFDSMKLARYLRSHIANISEQHSFQQNSSIFIENGFRPRHQSDSYSSLFKELGGVLSHSNRHELSRRGSWLRAKIINSYSSIFGYSLLSESLGYGPGELS